MAVPQQGPTSQHEQTAPEIRGDEFASSSESLASDQPRAAMTAARSSLRFYPNSNVSQTAAMLKGVDAQGREVPKLSTASAWVQEKAAWATQSESRTATEAPAATAHDNAREAVDYAAMVLPALALANPAVNILTEVSYHLDRGDAAQAKQELISNGIETGMAIAGMVIPGLNGIRKVGKHLNLNKLFRDACDVTSKSRSHSIEQLGEAVAGGDEEALQVLDRISREGHRLYSPLAVEQLARGSTDAYLSQIRTILLDDGRIYTQNTQQAMVLALRKHASRDVQFDVLKSVVVKSESDALRRSALTSLVEDHANDPAVSDFLIGLLRRGSVFERKQILHTALQPKHYSPFRISSIDILKVALEETQQDRVRIAAARHLLQLTADHHLPPEVAADIRLTLLRFRKDYPGTVNGNPIAIGSTAKGVMEQIDELYQSPAQPARRRPRVEPSRSETRSPQTYLFAPENQGVFDDLARSKFLTALDFDGTLAKIAKTPGGAAMTPSTVRLLTDLSQLGPVAIITGRSLANVRPLIGGVPVQYIIGNHGLEGIGLDLTKFESTIRAAYHHLDSQLPKISGVRIEDKQYSLAVHYRLSPDPVEAYLAIRSAAKDLPNSVRVEDGKMVVNIVATEAPNKGDAVLRLCAKERVARALFCGDDRNDAPAQALGDYGVIGVHVGKSDASPARYFIKDQAEIDRVLQTLIDFLRGWPQRN